MKIIDNIVRVVVGVLFIFSGLVKLVDPMGTAIKMEEYFEVFEHDISSIFQYLIPLALWVGLFVIVLEILLGVAVLINFRMKLTSWVLLLLIVFFTFLTFYSAAFDKVTDCGCFGDAIPLTPWQSFMKDILLMILIGYIFMRRKAFQPLVSTKVALLIIGTVFIGCAWLAFYALEHLPPIDFRPYKVGTDIRKAMKPSADFKYLYIMEKDGEQFEFETYPVDTTYKFVEMVLLNPEAQPKITDFSIWNDEGDFTEEALTGNKMLVLILDVNKARVRKIPEISRLAGALKGRVETWLITANDEATFDAFRHKYQLAFPYYFADGTVMKAMIRANPGIILLKDGVVMGKWHNNDIPSEETVLELIK